MSLKQMATVLQKTPSRGSYGDNEETTALITLNQVAMGDGGGEAGGEQMMQRIPMGELKVVLDEDRSPQDVNLVHQSHPINNNSSLLSQGNNLSLVQSRVQVDMTAEMNRYFDECASNIKEFDAYKNKFVLVANHKIKKLIKAGNIEISHHCEDISFKDREKARLRQIEQKKRLVEVQKYEIIRKLKTIQQQQIQLVHKSIKQNKNKSVQMKKVPYSPEQKQKVASALKAKKQFDKLLQQKTDQYIKNSLQFKKAQEEQIKKAQQAENSRKKQEIAKRLKEMELRTEERKEILKNSVLKVHHNYIHKQLQKKYKSLQKISQQQAQNKLKQISIKHKLNIDQINEHDRKYREHLEKRSQSLSQIKSQAPQIKKYRPTHFAKVIDEELFQIKQRNFQRLMKVKQNQYKTKIAKYQQKIDQEHKPKVDPSKSIPVVPRTYSSVTLTNEERIQKGLEYLAKAKEMKRCASEVVEAPKEVQNYGYKAYKDYLKEREPSNIDATEKEFKQIMSNKQQKDYNSLLRAKFLAEGLQAKSKKGVDDKLYFSAKTKLSLLSQLY